MKYEQSAAGDATNASSRYGDPDEDADETRDERSLYGEPRHETDDVADEQTLYGEPQHETEEYELPDLELLFARMRAESATGPTVLPPRSDLSTADATER